MTTLRKRFSPCARVLTCLALSINAASSYSNQPPKLNTICSADLVCVSVYQGQTVRLVLDNKSSKPLSFQLYLRGGLTHIKLGSIRLQQPETIQLLNVSAPLQPWGFDFRIHHGHAPRPHNDNHLYTLPYAPDTRYPVTQSYDRLSSHHRANVNAIDWAIPEGQPVYAARDGVVVSVFEHSSNNSLHGQATANHIWIEHSDGTVAKYLHLAYQSVLVREGDSVIAGEEIAAVGNTGYSSGAHLHFSVSSLGGSELYRTFKVKFKTHTGAKTLKFGDSYLRP